ncbi:YlbD family protein [Tuberibacillus sp. Marseille-P3662]|uniref:YlbD family protein n=1 Tax=Tuberibacillus sp. Marseille-P3662 TaxID=1965358 RepID=UPI001592C2A1|nr:YlbD family protein [Tuberibacillus sp. Marseille-P3662]
MASQTTADALKQFKAFVREHPEMVQTVREEGKSWKDVFEEWVLFGEDHEIWEDYGIDIRKGEAEETSSSQGESIQHFIEFISRMDPDNVNKHLDQINGALTNIHDIITQIMPQRSHQYISSRPAHMMPQAGQQPPTFKRD